MINLKHISIILLNIIVIFICGFITKEILLITDDKNIIFGLGIFITGVVMLCFEFIVKHIDQYLCYNRSKWI